MGNYLFHPKSVVKLGRAFDVRSPFNDTSVNGFFAVSSKEEDPSEASATETFNIKEARDYTELFERMKLDIKLEAKFSFGSVNASFSDESSFSFTEENLIYVAQASKVYSPVQVETVELSEKGKKFWQEALKSYATNKDAIHRFQRTAGTDIVTQLTRGSQISLVYVFKCSSSEKKRTIKAQLEAGWTTGSVSVDFESELKRKDENLSVSIYGFQTAVSSQKVENGQLSDIINSKPGDIPKIKAIIANILREISLTDRNRCPILEFNTLELQTLAEISLSKGYKPFMEALEVSNEIDEAVIDLIKDRYRLQEQLNIIERIETTLIASDYKPNGQTSLQTIKTQLQTEVTKLRQHYSKIKDATKVTNFTYTLPQILTPQLNNIVDMPLVYLIAWTKALDVERIGNEAGKFNNRYWFKIMIKLPEYLDIIDIVLNQQTIHRLRRADILSIYKNDGSVAHLWNMSDLYPNVYVWGWHAADLSNVSQSIIAGGLEKEKNKSYSLSVTDIYGNNYRVDIGNIVNPVYKDKNELRNLIHRALPLFHKSLPFIS
ncbi:MAG: hypothetical protein QM668_18290 [Agriterribacter sp.]